jgi:hypothetical protein
MTHTEVLKGKANYHMCHVSVLLVIAKGDILSSNHNGGKMLKLVTLPDELIGVLWYCCFNFSLILKFCIMKHRGK